MNWLLSAIVAIFVLFFFPGLTDPLFGAKNFFLAAAVLVAVITAGAKLLRSKKLTYSLSFLDVLVFLFFVANLVSWFLLPSGVRARSLVQPLGLGTIAGLTILYFALGQISVAARQRLILPALLISLAISSLVSIILFVLPPTFFARVTFLNSNWSPLGSSFVLAQLALPVLVLIFAVILKEVSKKDGLKSWWLAVLGVLIFVGGAVGAYQAVKTRPVMMDWFSSWATTVESFKRKPLFGIGPGNFNTAFNLYRPVEFNQKANWQVSFGFPRNYFLQVWAETGLLSLIIILLLALRSLRLARRNEKIWLMAPVWLVLFLLPANLMTVFLLFLALALVRGEGKQRHFSLIVGEGGRNGAPIVVGILLSVAAIAGGYFVYQGLAAERTFYQALLAASQNKGKETYDLQVKAIQQNRFLSRYRIAFAQTNLALANSIASKKELTDDEKNQISQLLSQAVNEAKAAVALEPKSVAGWENLSQIYRQLINVVSGADSWAVAAYQQTIALNPLDPRLRLDFGGLYYGFNKFEEAAKQFELAVNLKSDYANAWYNWAWALKQQKKLQEAVTAMQQAVALVDVNSTDYEKASKEFEEWKKELGATAQKQEQPQQPEQLTKPEPLPSPKLEEPIRLPEEAAPPIEESTEEEATPTMEPTPVL